MRTAQSLARSCLRQVVSWQLCASQEHGLLSYAALVQRRSHRRPRLSARSRLQVQVGDPKALERIRQEEMDISTRRIRKVLDAGANVILTTKGIDDFCLKIFVEAGCIACRRVPKDELKRIARATGAPFPLERCCLALSAFQSLANLTCDASHARQVMHDAVPAPQRFAHPPCMWA
jgi:TCP-1/cpn60 chaperonin family